MSPSLFTKVSLLELRQEGGGSCSNRELEGGGGGGSRARGWMIGCLPPPPLRSAITDRFIPHPAENISVEWQVKPKLSRHVHSL